VTPAFALAGGNSFTLTLYGTNFTSTLALTFGATQLAATTVSATRMTATVPAALIASVGIASITVTNVTGTSSATNFTINQPPPAITSFSPSSTVAGGPGLLLTINGTNFDAASVASWGSTALVTTLLSTTQLTATLPAALSANPSTGSITVSTDGGVSKGAAFTILPRPPTITSLSPSLVLSGSGAFTLTINGTNFTSTSATMWNNTKLATTYVSSTQLTAAVSASLITASSTPSITVSTTGAVTPAATLTINPPAPTITSVTPAFALAGGNSFTLIVSGTNLTSTSTLTFGATQLAATAASARQMTATVPAALIASVGTASITVTNITGTSPGASFTINQPPPTITSLSPSSTVVSGPDLLLTINGANFDATSVASWGSTALATTLLSATQLTATLPAALTAHYGTGSITVSTDGGVTSAKVFTILPPPPTITSLSPASVISGSGAFTLTITGTNFTSTSATLWNNTKLATTYVSSTQLTAAVSASLITASSTPSITVSTTGGVSSAVTFTVNPPAPIITSLKSASALAGGNSFTLTVCGTNFTSTSTLTFGSTQLAATIISAKQMTVTVPAALIASVGTAAITVTNSTGTSPTANFSIYQPPPTLTSLSPASTVAGGPDFLLTINGTNFDAASVASWGSTALATTLLSATQLTATLPAALTANYGTGSITVSTDGGLTSAKIFTILPPPPTITSLSPAFVLSGGAAFTLTITGTNFIPTSTVLWNSSKLATTYVNSTQLTAAVPASLITTVSTPSVTVSTTGGVSPAATFNVNPLAPTITSLNPSKAAAGNPAYTLTINGTNFTATSTAMWNSTALAVTYVSAKQLTVAVPASLIAGIGTAGVTVSNVTGTTSSATVTINPPPPVITSLTPDSVLTSKGAFTMTVNGTNFQPGTGATVVRWNNSALTTTYVSSTQLTAVVPANLLSYGSTSVYVISTGGISPGFPFTVIPPPPTITNLGLTGVPAGFGTFTMSIYGTYFTPSLVLYWGTTPLSGQMIGSITYTFTVPANLVTTPGPVSLTVTTIGGTSAPVTFTVKQPTPTIASLSTTSIAAGSAAFTLTINGSNFISGVTARWNSTRVGITSVTSTQLTVNIPASLIATAGAAGIEVITSGGLSNSAPFTINPAPPVITSVSPTSATAGSGGFLLIITGAAFTTTSTVLWGAAPLDTLYVNPTQLKASVPASLLLNFGTASISVVSQAGASASANFTIKPAPPQICGFSPGLATAGGAGFTMTINGEFFTPSTTSKWGATPLAITYISSTQLTAVVPAKLIATASTAKITVTTAIGTSPMAAFTILSATPPPTITTTTLPAATAGLAYSGPIHLTGGVPGYTWTVTGLPADFSYFNTSGSTLTITGTPASAGPISFQVSAQDTAGNTATLVTLTINVNPGPSAANSSRLSGSYACLLQGSIDGDGTRWASILSFQADGQGNFSNGIFDTNSIDVGSASGILSGTYNIGADNNGLASIHTILTDNAAGVQTTQWAIALTGSAQPATEFRLVEADDLGTLPSGQQGTAQCFRATPSAFAATSVDGLSFAYALDGEDNSSNLKTTAGRFTTSSGAITSGHLDTTEGGSATDQPTAFTGTYTEPDPVWGRFTLALTGAGASTGYTVYMIDANRMFILDNTSNDGEQAGNLRRQQPAATTTAALSGPFVLYNRGAQFNSNSGIPTSFYANLLIGAADGAGNLTIKQSYVNAAGTYAAGQSTGGPTPLAFDSNNPGRASFPTATGTTYLYFFNANSAFEMSVGANGSVDSGLLEARSQTTFTSAALAGKTLFGELPPLSVQPTAYLSEYSLSSSGAITASVTTSAEGVLSWDQPLSATYAWDPSATGSGGFFITNGADGAASCASISATHFACIPQTNPAPSVQIMQQ
jgi:hypothetical protein